jgi:membrane associated rhomboid family serine protease
MLRITDVVKNLIIINVIMYFGTLMLMGDSRILLAMFPPGTEYFNPYQIISHMFMHADLMHLFFNMFGLFMFGPPLESLWGTKKFLFFYLAAGFGALAIHLITGYLGIQEMGGPVLGASGALYGVLVGYGMNFPNAKLALIFFPVPVAAKYFIPGLLVLDLLGGFTGFSIFGQNIAHFAHVGGAIFGFLMIMYWRKFGSRL